MVIESRAMQLISRHLESLKENTDGGELHTLIARALRRYRHHGQLDVAALIDLHNQLESYARDPVALPGMRVRARLLQQHLAGFLPEPPAATPPGEGVMGHRPPSATAAAEKYNSLLRSENDAWRAIYGTVKDYQKLKTAWMHSLDELARQRDVLEHKLAQTAASLTTIEAERDQLLQEVETLRTAASTRPRATVVRLAVRPSAKAGVLARRDTLVRQLEAEIKRLKRSSRPLALGFIAVDDLQRLAADAGEQATAAALQCYVQEVLSNFRAYDVVAFYQDAVFAILFPETSREGAQRALEKAYKRAAETHVHCGDRALPLPRFLSALVMYRPGEDAATMLQRAQAQLDAVRHQK